MSVSLTISGDFCITPSYLEKNLLSKEIISLFSKQDVNIVNLECPINNGSDENKILKNGPHLQTREAIFSHLKKLNIHAVSLANNHILDFDIQGLQSTMKGCKNNNIIFTGAGNNLKEAQVPAIIEKNGLRIAIVNFCENESSIATEFTAGANPLDIIDNLAQIKKAKAAADFVLVVIHGGNEYYNLPSPRVVKQYRFFAENGADTVVSHHTHCISGYEIHNGVPIFYGLGNMLFTKQSDQPGWHTGLTLHIDLEKDKPLKWELIPLAQSKENFELHLPADEQKQQLLKEAEQYSSIIANEIKLKAAWKELVEKRKGQYLFAFSPMNIIPGRYLKGALKRLGLMKILFPEKYLLPLINYLNCEAHLDISKEVLDKKLLEK